VPGDHRGVEREAHEVHRQDAEAAVAALGTLAEGFKRAGAKLGVLMEIPSG